MSQKEDLAVFHSHFTHIWIQTIWRVPKWYPVPIMDVFEASTNETLRNNIFFYQSLLALIGSVIIAVPFFFYDLTEKKHANIVRVLRIRAATDNYRDDRLQPEDITYLKEIVEFAKETGETMVTKELAKYDCIDRILEQEEMQVN